MFTISERGKLDETVAVNWYLILVFDQNVQTTTRWTNRIREHSKWDEKRI